MSFKTFKEMSIDEILVAWARWHKDSGQILPKAVGSQLGGIVKAPLVGIGIEHSRCAQVTERDCDLIDLEKVIYSLPEAQKEILWKTYYWNDPDVRIADDLHICRRTVLRWRGQAIERIEKEVLGLP